VPQPEIRREISPRIKCSSLRFKCNGLLYLNRGLPGSAVYDLGTVRRRARRHFLADDIRNPLGFVYTLYGRATVRLGGGQLITASRHEEASPP
jgi:hypothetical protein